MASSIRRTLASILLLAAPHTAARAQGVSGVLNDSTLRSVRGVVVDTGNHPIRGVTVSARGHGTVITNDSGSFRFQLPRSDAVVFDLRRLGLGPAQYALGSGHDTTIVVLMLPTAQELGKVQVTAREAASARMSGFEERLNARGSETMSAYFITAADIEKRGAGSTASLFAEIPTMRVVTIAKPRNQQLSDPNYLRGGEVVLYGISRAGGSMCKPTVYVDGIRTPDVSIDNVVQPGEIAGIEVYTTANKAPTQYQFLNGGCAVVLIWRKGG
jgi:hypothetical protein